MTDLKITQQQTKLKVLLIDNNCTTTLKEITNGY
jgi:hypothetical protein